MAKSHKFQLDRKDKPTELLFGLGTSILLHFILFIAANYWLKSVASEQRQAFSQAIPIEYVEVPPDKTKTPKETSKRAANNSVGKGEVSKPNNFSAPKPTKSSSPKLTGSTAVSPNRYSQKLQSTPPVVTPARTPAKLQPQKLAVAPTTPPVITPARIQPKLESRKLAVTPTTPPVVTPARTQPKLQPQKLAVTPTTPPLVTPARTQPKLESRKLAVAPTTPPVITPATPAKLQPQKLAVAPTTPPVITPARTQPKLQPQKLAVAPTTPPVANPAPEQLETSATPQKPSQVKPAQKSGAASRLGGPVSVSSRDFGGNYFAASSNSNRFNPDFNGIDARQDTNLGPYLKELQRQVRQQWIPELTQSSRRSVLHFTVSRSGQLSNLQIARTSGFSVTDEAAVSAVKRAAPFIPLPTTYRGNNISIEFTFVINVDGELDIQGSGQN
ncbi:TonB family protein [aff. Roholtiella sp. LEGE 12411]|uniref:TonB family protein n=1 Tax=aff. Roholtiella sp. LEGE 12411 TaxID=1828822 RepID=UPI0018820573|nr:TonB family protein [aff. Roholtiella sp. LEGE 12411]MBE9037347.1 TonB family protein [aff. Roholtiella sp. LEGE 12411]